MSQLQPTQIASVLSGACTPGERSRLANQLAAEKGVSPQSIYTAAKKGGFISGRTRRADAGNRKLEVTDDQLSQVAKIIHASHTEKGRIPMPAHEAIRLAEAQGIIPAGIIAEAYLCQWMAKRKISKRDAVRRTPHTPLMSKYPNHVHMIDASQCAQWYINEKGAVAHQRRGMEVYKNKTGNPNKITRLLLIDHCSGAFFVHYTQSESALDWIDFLYNAWSDKATPETPFPFCGMPEMVYADNGSPIKSEITQNVLRNLGIVFDTHMPGRPRAKGANETMQRHWERWFESGLKITPAQSMEQLNAWAFDRCAHINATRIFTRHGHPRFDFWQARIGQIRAVPDYQFYRSFATSEPETRKVGMDGTIRFKPRSGALPFETSGVYAIRHSSLYGTEVEVSYCLYDYPKIKITSRRTGQYFEAEPLIRNAAGFYPEISATLGENFKSPAQTETQKAFIALDNIEAVPLTHVHAIPGSARALTRTDDLSSTTTPAPLIIPFTMPEEDTERVYSYLKARRRLLEKLGARHTDEIHPVQRQIISAITSDITEKQMQEIFHQLTQVDSAEIISLEGAANA